MRVIFEFECDNEEMFDELYCELSNFDGYVASYKKKDRFINNKKLKRRYKNG